MAARDMRASSHHLHSPVTGLSSLRSARTKRFVSGILKPACCDRHWSAIRVVSSVWCFRGSRKKGRRSLPWTLTATSSFGLQPLKQKLNGIRSSGRLGQSVIGPSATPPMPMQTWYAFMNCVPTEKPGNHWIHLTNYTRLQNGPKLRTLVVDCFV